MPTHKTLTAILTAVALTALPAAAHAVTYPGDRPGGPGPVADAAFAVAFWQARGVDRIDPQTGKPSVCPDGITVHVADTLDDRDTPIGTTVIGRGADCNLWLLADRVRDAQHATIRLRSRTRWVRGIAAASLREQCAATLHETGHALGLAMPVWDGTAWHDGHPATGIMAPVLTEMPFECKRRYRVDAAGNVARHARTASRSRRACRSHRRCRRGTHPRSQAPQTAR